MFSEKDELQIKNRGSELQTVLNRIENFKKGFPFLQIEEAASIGDGIIKLDEKALEKSCALYDKKVADGIKPLKFVPASGAASRMFKALFEALEECKKSDSPEEELINDKVVKQFIDQIENFAFYNDLKNSIQKEKVEENCKNRVDYLLNEKGLNPVAFEGFSSRDEAVKSLRSIQKKENKDAWLLDINSLKLQPSGEYNYIIRFEEIDESTHQAINTSLSTIKIEGVEDNAFSELRFEAVGPIIGNELKTKAVQSIVVVLVFIVLYIAFAFRKVSKPVASWKFGIAAIIALVHDVLIIAGIFAALGYFINIEVDSLFVTALLTILGFSVHDTIVTFDRTRENLFKNQDKGFDEIVNISVNQTIIRSINTSVTTLLVLMAIYFFGGDSIKNFVLALILGVIIGTYSSIFLASPLLTIWRKVKS